MVAVRRGTAMQAAVLPMLVVVASIALHGTWAIDDAGISWAYAHNLATGRGSVAYPGGPVGEGFSNPLWVLALAGAESVGLRADLSAKTLGLVAGALGVVLTPFLVRELDVEARLLVGTTLATSASWALWSAAGLETALVGVLLVATTLAARSSALASATGLAALASLTRPEGALLAVGALVAGRAAPRTLVGPVAAVALWTGLRLSTYGLWFPLPAYVKMSVDAGSLVTGVVYTIGALSSLGALTVLGLATVQANRRRDVARDLAPVGMAIVFCLVSGGDWMRHGRFLVPVIPFLIAAVVPLVYDWAGRGSYGVLFTALAASPQLVEGVLARMAPPLPMSVQIRQGEVLRRIGRSACGDSFPYVATPDVGGVLWTQPGLRVADLGGLTEPDLVGKLPQTYWPTRLTEQPVHTIYLHGSWPDRTGLGDDVLRHAGYRRVCRRGDTDRAPTMWVHRRCDLALEGADLEVVEYWCLNGGR